MQVCFFLLRVFAGDEKWDLHVSRNKLYLTKHERAMKQLKHDFIQRNTCFLPVRRFCRLRDSCTWKFHDYRLLLPETWFGKRRITSKVTRFWKPQNMIFFGITMQEHTLQNWLKKKWRYENKIVRIGSSLTSPILTGFSTDVF